jgi:hypothetical protein
MPSDTTVMSLDGAPPARDGDGDPGVEVRPVDDVGCREDTGSGDPIVPHGAGREVERLHRLVLETRVAALEAQLEHKERQLSVVRRQYERILDQRERAAADEDDGHFSWSVLG